MGKSFVAWIICSWNNWTSYKNTVPQLGNYFFRLNLRPQVRIDIIVLSVFPQVRSLHGGHGGDPPGSEDVPRQGGVRPGEAQPPPGESQEHQALLFPIHRQHGAHAWRSQHWLSKVGWLHIQFGIVISWRVWNCKLLINWFPNYGNIGLHRVTKW